MNITRATILALLVALLGAAAPASAFPDDASQSAERQADLYDEGTDAIDEERWDDAVRYFKQAAEIKGSRTDGSIYWTAYALNRLGRRAESLQAIDSLKKAYPSSRWLDDARALELEVRQDRGEKVAPDKIDDVELKMMAIQSLMRSDPEKAFPLLEKIVRGPSHTKVKERALFVLSQSASPRAQALMADLARGTSNPDLQEEAIRYIGIAGGDRNRQLLSELYGSTTSKDAKEQILKAFMIAGDKARILSAAKGEKDAELREEAIRLLGVMGARADLHQMYSGEPSKSVREEILRAMFLAGDADRLGDIARNEKDPDLREDAIRNLGLIGKTTAPILLSIYAGETSADVKEAVIQGLFLQGNSRALIDLSRRETNRELRKEIVQKLSLMRDEDAVQFMLEILEQ